MYIDTHCHLDLLDLSAHEGQLSKALEAARQRGVSRYICIGVEEATWSAVLAVAEDYDDVYATVGVHPLHLQPEQLPSVESLSKAAAHPKVVAIGETGLDYHYDAQSAKAQQESLVRHIACARHCNKPLVIHTREARADTLAVLRAEGASKGVMHCFTEDWETAKGALDLGFYISFSGIVTFANARSLREVARQVPLDRLLIETDSPWLAPVPYRGKKNEPAYVVEVAAALAELRGLSVEALALQTTTNACRLFGLP